MGKKKSKSKDIERNRLARELAVNKGQSRADKLAYSKKDRDLRWQKR